MKQKNFRESSVEELRVELVELNKALFSARVQLAVRQFENTSEFRKIRRDIARIKTVITEKERVKTCQK